MKTKIIGEIELELMGLGFLNETFPEKETNIKKETSMKKTLVIPDLFDECMDLYYSKSPLDEMEELGLIPYGIELDAQGNELRACDQLNTPKERKEINEWIEAKAAQDAEEDKLCDAALMKWPEGHGEYEPDFWEQEQEYYEFLADSGYVHPEQQRINFEFFMKELGKANNFKRLAILRDSIPKSNENSSQEQKNRSWRFFRPGDHQVIWNQYRERKNHLNQVIKRK